MLGVVPSHSGKSADCALCTRSLCEYFEVCDGIFCICADTTAANVGHKNGAIVILAQVIKNSFLWLCRHNICKIFTHFEDDWTDPDYPALSVPGATGLFKKIIESRLHVGSDLHRIYLESMSFISCT